MTTKKQTTLSPEIAEQKKMASRGRPATGKAKSSTERGKVADEALLRSGGLILSRVRLSPEAAAALVTLTERDGTNRAAIEQALIFAAKII